MNFKFVNIILTVIVMVICLFFSYSLFFTDVMPRIQGNQRYILATILIAYAVFRSLRLRKMF